MSKRVNEYCYSLKVPMLLNGKFIKGSILQFVETMNALIEVRF